MINSGILLTLYDWTGLAGQFWSMVRLDTKGAGN